jgi:hypothetical protein
VNILTEFAETARRETDLDALTDQLLEAVQGSLQPEKASIWLKGMGGSSKVSKVRFGSTMPKA